MNPLGFDILGAAQRQGLPSELAMNDIIAQLAARVASAQGAAAQASTAYGTAAAAPEPNIYRDSPGRVAVGTGLARLAEGLGATDQPVERARQTIGAQQKSMSERRLENLKSLHTTYENLAKRAEQLGDLEQTAKYKHNADKVAREQQKIDEATKSEAEMARVRLQEQGDTERTTATITAANARHTADLTARRGDITARGQQDRITDAAKAKLDTAVAQGAPGSLAVQARALLTNQAKLTDFNDYPGHRTAILKHLQDTGQVLLPPKATNTLADLNAARAAIAKIRRLSLGDPAVKGDRGINTGVGLGTYGVAAGNTLKALRKEHPNLIAFRGAIKGLASTISKSTGERGVLTDKDIQRAMSLNPNEVSSRSEAETLIKQYEEWIAETEQRTIETFTTPLGGGSPVGTVRLIAPDGSELHVPPGEVDEAISAGAARP